jgi:hypothetical protein
MDDDFDMILPELLYGIDPHIQINNATINKELEHSAEWKIDGFIDMDGGFFDHSGIYRLFMKDKSFTMFINASSSISDVKNQLKYARRLSDLLNLSISRITFSLNTHELNHCVS